MSILLPASDALCVAGLHLTKLVYGVFFFSYVWGDGDCLARV